MHFIVTALSGNSVLCSVLKLVDEFLGSQRVVMAPQTFHMGSLLQEMREIEEAEVKFVPQRGEQLFQAFKGSDAHSRFWPFLFKRT